MKKNLPKLTLALGLVLITFPAPGRADDGQSLVATAAANMAAHTSLQARVRQRVSLYGRELSGHGTYQQARLGEHTRLRLELKLPVGDRATSLQQINDGDHLWTRRDSLQQQSVSVVDLRKVRAAWQETQAAQPASALVVGGIAQLLTGLNDSFTFNMPEEGMLGNEPIWIVEGTWKGPRAGEGSGQSLDHIPQHVTLMLSRDQLLPLFPFRVEYSRFLKDAAGRTKKEPLLILEFFEVRAGGPVDPRYFTYTVGDQEIVDETDRFLDSMRAGK
jgi:hypothetical protein